MHSAASTKSTLSFGTSPCQKVGKKINGLKLKRRRKVVKIILKNTISITLLRRKEGEKSRKCQKPSLANDFFVYLGTER